MSFTFKTTVDTRFLPVLQKVNRMYHLNFEVPRSILTSGSHDEHKEIFFDLFQEFEKSEDWLGRTAACLADFLNWACDYEQAAKSIGKQESLVEVLIGSKDNSRVVRIEHRALSSQRIYLKFSVASEAEFFVIEFGSGSFRKIDAIITLIERFDGRFNSCKRAIEVPENTSQLLEKLPNAVKLENQGTGRVAF